LKDTDGVFIAVQSEINLKNDFIRSVEFQPWLLNGNPYTLVVGFGL